MSGMYGTETMQVSSSELIVLEPQRGGTPKPRPTAWENLNDHVLHDVKA